MPTTQNERTMKHRVGNNPLFRRVGRRGSLLIISGLAWVGIGIDIGYMPNINRFSTPGADPSAYLHAMDLPWTAYVWGLSGAAAVVIGLLGRRSPIDRREIIGFNFILTPPLLWTLAYAWSLITYVLTNGAQGRLTSGIALIIYALVTLFILVIAGWPDVSTNGLIHAPLPPPDEES